MQVTTCKRAASSCCSCLRSSRLSIGVEDSRTRCFRLGGCPDEVRVEKSLRRTASGGSAAVSRVGWRWGGRRGNYSRQQRCEGAGVGAGAGAVHGKERPIHEWGQRVGSSRAGLLAGPGRCAAVGPEHTKPFANDLHLRVTPVARLRVLQQQLPD